jgi:lysophospholipase L1-like esterase
VLAGEADRTVETVQANAYVTLLKPKTVLLNIGRNDLASGVASATWQANYQSIVANAVAAGANVVHLMPIPETTQDQSTLTAFINATYPSGLKIDVSPAWVNATHLSADGTHPNAAGHTLIKNTILANSGLSV